MLAVCVCIFWKNAEENIIILENMWHQKPLIIQLISQDFQNILDAKNGLNIN